jgi:hypothetical protein
MLVVIALAIAAASREIAPRGGTSTLAGAADHA